MIMGVRENCQMCGKASLDIWMINSCRHLICGKCVEEETSLYTCGYCWETTEGFWCPGRRHGCKFQGTIAEVKLHAKTCGFVPVPCPNDCDEAPCKKSLVKHVSQECRLRLAECEFCGQGCYALNLVAHHAVCEEAMVSCTYCHVENIRRKWLPHHAKDCSRTPKPCPMKKQGCTYEAVDSEMEKHLHFRNHVSCFDCIDDKLQKLQLDYTILRSDQRNQTASLTTNERPAIGGVSFFDKELLWLVKLPDVYTTGDLSTIFRQRGTDWTFALEINCAGPAGETPCSENGEFMYSVYMMCLAEGQRTEGVSFTLQAESINPGGKILKNERLMRFVPSIGKTFVLKFKCASDSTPAKTVLIKFMLH